MEASKTFPEFVPAYNYFRVWVEDTADTYFEVGENTGRWVKANNFAPTQYFIELNGQRLGLLHCDVTANGQEAFVDGIDVDDFDPEDGLAVAEEDLTDGDWESIAVCVHDLTQVRLVNHPAGQTPFLESV